MKRAIALTIAFDIVVVWLLFGPACGCATFDPKALAGGLYCRGDRVDAGP